MSSIQDENVSPMQVAPENQVVDDESPCQFHPLTTVHSQEPNTGTDSHSSLPKLWDVRDPFEYAPPKPEEDPWTLLVDPLIMKDKVQCDAWKDEVQNLLIFVSERS